MLRLTILTLLFFWSYNSYANFGNKKPTEDDITCLAQNIYHEARGESFYGRLAIANVTLNRVNSNQFPKTVCGVVKQKTMKGCQFSWVCNNRAIKNQHKYNEAYDLSSRILKGKLKANVVSSDVLWFHNKHVIPHWTKHGTYVIRIGSHSFYKNVSK